MKRMHRTVSGIAVALSVALGAAGTAGAHPGGMGAGDCMDGQSGMKAGHMDGMHSRMDDMQGQMDRMHGQKGAMQDQMGGMHARMAEMHAMQHGPEAGGAAHTLMTPEEHSAFRQKMQSATTPEERKKLAQANRAEMEKRAIEKGVALPPAQGPLHNH